MGFYYFTPAHCQVSGAHEIHLTRPLTSLRRHEPAHLASDSSFESPWDPLAKPLYACVWVCMFCMLCMFVCLYVFCLNTLEDSRRGTVGRGSVCHSAPASKHTCVYESVGKDIMAEARNAWPRLMITTFVIQKSSIFPHMKYLQMQNLCNWNPYVGPQ